MSVNVAELGIAVRYESVTAAANENNRLAQSAGTAERSVRGLGTAGAQANASLNNMALVMQRLNSAAGLTTGALGGMSAFFARLGPWGLALGVLADAALGFYNVFKDKAPQAEEALKAHEKLIGSVKSSYDSATDSSRKFFEQTKAVVELQLRQREVELRSELQSTSNTALQGMTSGNLGSKLNNLLNGLVPESMRTNEVRNELAAFEDAIIEFQQSVKAGEPAAREFQDRLAKIGLATPALQQVAAALVNTTEPARVVQKMLEQTLASQKLVAQGGGALSERQRGILGLPDKKTIDDGSDAIERQLAVISKHTALTNANAPSQALSSGTLEQLRQAAQAQERSANDNRPETPREAAA